MVIGELSHNISTKNIFTDEQNMILWNIIKEELYKFKEKVDSNKDNSIRDLSTADLALINNCVILAL